MRAGLTDRLGERTPSEFASQIALESDLTGSQADANSL
jgi:hypothetical protein